MVLRCEEVTNADLPTLMKDGKFKRDLLDRLSFEVLFLPPLRERGEDIMLLANHFAARMSYEMGREEVPEFSDDAIDALERYPWPGNVRELKNVVERAVYRSNSPLISDIDFDPFRSPYRGRFVPKAPEEEESAADEAVQPADERIDKPFTEAVRELEIRLVRSALKEARHNQRKAARALGLTYHQIRGLYRKYKDDV